MILISLLLSLIGLVFVDATHEAIDSRALTLLPAMYSLMIVLCRANFCGVDSFDSSARRLRRLSIDRVLSSA